MNLLGPFEDTGNTVTPVFNREYLTINPSTHWNLSVPTLCNSRTVAHQAPLSTEFSRKYLIRYPFPSENGTQAFPIASRVFYHLNPQGRPKIREWVAFAFTREHSGTRNWTGVFHRSLLASYCKVSPAFSSVSRGSEKSLWVVEKWLFLQAYLELVYLVTALVPSDTACLTNSPGSSRRTAVWISLDVMVDRLL